VHSSSKAKRKQHQQLQLGHRAQQLLQQLIVLLPPAARQAQALQHQGWPSRTPALSRQLQSAPALHYHQQMLLLLQSQ
jgi:hypothetical protein